MRRLSALGALAIACALTAVAVAAPPGSVNQRGDGWPRINGMLLMNDHNGSRPLDARVGRDPFGGTDRKYRCDGKKRGGKCKRFLERCEDGSGLCVKDMNVHNELLGGHGNDTIFGGAHGDVLWADFKPGGPKRQRDKITGGAGRDFIYGGPGRNVIKAGPGNDFVKSRYGRGRINCGAGNDILYTSRRYKRRYKITGCERQSTGPSPGQGGSATR
ncbi:MAG TPA: calcium-binding protein [Solirubrobacteraceae bacterium]|jgi:Ca2+-binding RTX toxin-like protein